MRLIDADALKESFINTDAKGINLLIDKYAIKCIEEAPTIEAKPVRRGRWVVEPGIGCWCSACGFDIGNELDFMEYVNYCPNCGAKMEE